MGLFGGLGKAFGGDFADRAARAQAIVAGDYAGAAKLHALSQERKSDMRKEEKEAAAEAQAREVAFRALKGINLPDEVAATIASDPQMRAKYLGGEFESKIVSPGARVAGRQPDGAYGTLYEGAPRQHVIDGRIVDEDGRVRYDSPYPKITPGIDGSFMEQPRLGMPGQTPPPSVPAVPQQQNFALPPGWSVVDDEEEGGAGPRGPRPFPGSY